MNTNDLRTRLSAEMPEILTDIAMPRQPDYTDELIARLATRHQRPRWTFVGRWLPASLVPRRPAVVAVVPWRVIALAALLIIATVVAALLIGSSRKLPSPFGLARPGAIAYVADGEIWRSNADGSAARQLTSDPRIDLHPVFSRDGTKLAITRLSPPGSHANWEEWGSVLVTSEDGSQPVLIDDDELGISPVTWSSDGRFLVYSKFAAGLDQLVVARTDGSSTRLITAGRFPNWSPVLAPDDRRIAFVKDYEPVTGIFLIDVDGTNERALRRGHLFRFDLAAWSPDGRTLLFAAGRQLTGTVEVWSLDIASGVEHRLVDRPGNQLAPAWSPDGRRITYLEEVAPERYQVMVVEADGSNAHPISEVGAWTYPQWAPDARRVISVDARPDGGAPVLSILDPDGLEPATTSLLPDIQGLGRADLSSWQRLAP